MSVRPPKRFAKTNDDPIGAALEQEVLAEMAGTLARLNKKLERALARIPAAVSEPNEEADALRQLRLLEAGEALWHVQIQRELCGLTRHSSFYDHMGVPPAVRARIGPIPRRFSPD